MESNRGATVAQGAELCSNAPTRMTPIAPEGRAERPDSRTAAAFATSWNTVGEGSVYTRDQFIDWMAPVDPASIEGHSVLELGFGNGSLLYHMGEYRPARLVGIELGDTHQQARRNLSHLPPGVLELHRGDLTTAQLGQFDLVYCIGVLHHLGDPRTGFEAVIRHTRPGGRFHCWVYAEEGNGIVIHVVDPIRRVVCELPWWVTKYCVALPLAIPYFAYAKVVRGLSQSGGCRRSARLAPAARCLQQVDRPASLPLLPPRRLRPARHAADLVSVARCRGVVPAPP
jgi:SAM-dependent methyltransferase